MFLKFHVLPPAERDYVISKWLGCVVRMVVDSMLPHAEFRSNDHRKDAALG